MIEQAFIQKSHVLSFEIFPPKRDADIHDLPNLLQNLSSFSPDFISVTCGAAGTADQTFDSTLRIAEMLQHEYNTSALAHLTCVMATQENIKTALACLKNSGIRNILALRGDIPEGTTLISPPAYIYAYQLIEEIKKDGSFCIGAACYPEGHIDCSDTTLDIQHMLRKQEAGADFFISQICFENDTFLRFLDRAHHAGITKPITAGIMPILWRGQAERMIFMCGASLPSRVVKLLHKYEHQPTALRQAGIELCVGQMEGLLNRGVDGIHVYTMNKADTAEHCARRFQSIL